MEQVNWFAVMILGVWLAAGLACIGTQDSDPITLALVFSVIAGLGYFICG